VAAAFSLSLKVMRKAFFRLVVGANIVCSFIARERLVGRIALVYNFQMATSVKLRTAVPSVAAFGKSLGISERRQRSLISLVKQDAPSGLFRTARKSAGRNVETVRSEKVSRAKR